MLYKEYDNLKKGDLIRIHKHTYSFHHIHDDIAANSESARYNKDGIDDNGDDVVQLLCLTGIYKWHYAFLKRELIDSAIIINKQEVQPHKNN